MSEDGVTAAALAVRGAGPTPMPPAGELPDGSVPGWRAAGRGMAAAKAGWRGWWARFGLAEVCGTIAAVTGFTAGYLTARSLLAAAGLATICEAVGFYGCVGVKAAAAACRATAHLGGVRRLVAGAWHAITQQLASCAAARVIGTGCGHKRRGRPLLGGFVAGIGPDLGLTPFGNPIIRDRQDFPKT